MATIKDISDFIIRNFDTDGHNSLIILKHQKLLYYSQAWHLAFYGKPLFEGKFQAWVHGPVNREIYDVYKDYKGQFDRLALDDLISKDSIPNLTIQEKAHMGGILEVYGGFTGFQLEALTHEEEPWLKAREGYGEYDRCEVEIDEKLMESYYKKRIEN